MRGRMDRFRKRKNKALRTFLVPLHDLKHGILGETEVSGYPAEQSPIGNGLDGAKNCLGAYS